MDTSSIVAALDEEIASLTRARALLAGGAVSGRQGRIPGTTRGVKRRKLSAAARAKIAAAQKRRWAKQKKEQAATK